MTMSKEQSFLNANTVLLAIVISLSGWTLTRVAAISEKMSATEERYLNQNREMMELRSKIAKVDAEVQLARLEVARIQAQSGR